MIHHRFILPQLERHWAKAFLGIRGKYLSSLPIQLTFNCVTFWWFSDTSITLVAKWLWRHSGSNSNSNSHTEGLCRELGLLKVAEIYHFLVDQFIFRYHNKMLHKIFDQYFVKHGAIHQYSPRQSDLYLLPDYKKDIGRRSISFLGVKIWKQIILAKTNFQKKSQEMYATRNYQHSYKLDFLSIMNYKASRLLVSYCYHRIMNYVYGSGVFPSVLFVHV